VTETGWLRRLGPWVAIGTSPAALMVGGGVAEGNERWWLAAAIVVGVAALAALAAAQGVLGQRRHARLVDLASRSLGRMGGRRIASPALVVMMVGWFGFNASVAGAGLGRLLNVPDRAGIVIFAAIMLAVAWHGLNVLSWTALAAGIATVLLAAEGIHLALSDRTGPLLGDGHPASSLGRLPAIAIIVGYGAAFALRTPDFTHDLARARHVVLCATVGLALPLMAFATAGAILELTTGTWNLVDTLERLGSPTVAYAFVALGFIGSVLTNLYSGAISLEDALPGCSHRAGLVAIAVAGTAVATLHFADWMIPYLTAMALAAPCLIGVLWLDEIRASATVPGYRRLGIWAWAAGVGVGVALRAMDSPLALPAGLVTAVGIAAAPWLMERRRQASSIAGDRR
jgi:purine-cytosine permease-like protein